MQRRDFIQASTATVFGAGLPFSGAHAQNRARTSLATSSAQASTTHGGHNLKRPLRVAAGRRAGACRACRAHHCRGEHPAGMIGRCRLPQ